MLLTCDLGNTNFKFAVFNGEEPVKIASVNGHKFTRAFLDKFTFNQVAISSVIPDKTIELKKILLDEFKIRPFIINQQVQFNVEFEYDSPHTLGVDRVCSVEGALSLFKKHPLQNLYSKDIYIVTIDSGTATTINIVEYNKRFIGGMIAPGLDTMFNSLNKNTAQLPRTSYEAYSSMIGKNTESSIASGVINATIGLIERAYHHLKEIGAKEIVVYVTGGNGIVISKKLNFPVIYSEDLVLRGIMAIYERNKVD